MTFHHYILAAGHGQRAGGPKAWLPVEGSSLLERHVEFISTRGVAASTAISIQEGWRERCHGLHDSIHWVATDPGTPPLASLQALVKELPIQNWGFVYHVDMPLWDATIFDALQHAAVHAAPSSLAVVPTHDSRGGHPVVLSKFAASAILALDPLRDRLDHWLRQNETRRVPLEHSAVLENWNRPR